MGINMGRAQQIPQLCHIDVDARLIDPNVDCNKLNAPTPTERLEPASSQMKPYDPDQIGIPVIAPLLLIENSRLNKTRRYFALVTKKMVSYDVLVVAINK
ncbi:hypothetical protein Tco_0282252 [Tanacetum coccineum]